MGDRYERTTEHLRSTALALLRERGSRAFSVESLTKAADVGIGTVYERWDNRAGILEDVIGSKVLPVLRAAMPSDRSMTLDERIRVLFDTDSGRESLALSSEVLFAYRDLPQLEPLARDVVEVISAWLSEEDAEVVNDSLNWWLTSLAIGWGILRTGEVRVPPIADAVMFVLTGSGSPSGERCESVVRADGRSSVGAAVSDDAISRAIVEIAKDLLSSENGPGFSAREIGRRAGVSKGALYRRYESRADVIRKVLLTDMDEARFAWSDEFLEVLGGDNPVKAAAEAMERTLRRVYEDEPMMRRLLEVTVAARTDDSVRSHVVGHIKSAVDERLSVINGLQEIGILRRGASAENLSWFIQAVPIGTRLMASVGLPPEGTKVIESFESILSNCVELQGETHDAQSVVDAQS